MRISFKDAFCFVDFVDDLRNVYIDDAGRDPEVDDMIIFMNLCPELERRRHAKNLFELFCLFRSHWNIDVPYFGLGSPSRNVVAPDLSSVGRPFHSHLLSLSQICSFLNSGKSIVDVKNGSSLLVRWL